MVVIAPTNNKGGVGKTKISILLAEYFSLKLKKRVLGIDLDPQCNFSQRFLKMEIDPSAPQGLMPPMHSDYDPNDTNCDDWDGRSSIADIFFSPGVIPYPTYIENLDIAPGHADKLLKAEAVRRNEIVERVYNHLHLFVNDPQVKEAYDVIIIDTAPSKGPLTISAVRAATHILIPSVMEEQPIQGVYGMLQLWMQESLRRDPLQSLKLIGILPNMFRATKLHSDMLSNLRENDALSKFVMPVQLGQRTAYAEADVEGAVPKTVFDLPDKHIAKQEALQVCQYIAERVFSDDKNTTI
jgi:chromosome partitioning protein